MKSMGGIKSVSALGGAGDGLADVFSPYDFEFVGMQYRVGIQESALATAFCRIQRRCGKVYDFFQLLVGTEELFEKFDDIDPIEAFPAPVRLFLPLQTIVEIKSVHIECHSLPVHSTLHSRVKAASGAALTIQESMAMLGLCKDRNSS